MEMSVKQIRLWNARSLADRAGGISNFAEKIGKSQSYASQIIGATPSKTIGHRVAEDIAQAFGLSLAWMDTAHPKEWRHISDNEWADALLRILPETNETGASYAVTSPAPALCQLPVLSWEATGRPTPNGEGDDYMAVPFQTGPRAYILPVEGDAMAPDYPAGGFIIIDPDLEPRPNDDVIAFAVNAGRAVFRRLATDGGTSLLIATNPRYPTLDAGSIIGCVVGYFRPTRR